MNCRDFLSEFEERNALTQAARSHLSDCRVCRKISDEQMRVWQMIDGLQRIDAPKNFDFLVRSRIANARPEKIQPGFLPVLRYVLPLSLVLMVIGLFAFNSSFFFGAADVPQVAQNNFQPQVIVENQQQSIAQPEQFVVNNNSASSFSDENIVAAVSNYNAALPKEARNIQFVSVKSTTNSLPKPRRAAPGNRFDGDSRTSAATLPQVFTPESLNTNQTVENLPNVGNRKDITDEEIWSFIGIEIGRENGKRTVKAVTQNSSADRSGIKVGDVIEAIDGEKLSAEPIRAGKIQVKKLSVVRGTDTIVIDLQN